MNAKPKIPVSSILSPLCGCVICILLIIIFGSNPREALVSFFTGSFTSRYQAGNLFNSAAFLMIAGTGACIANKSGNMNLGGEGQVYLGGYITALILSSSINLPPVLKVILALLLCILSGMFMSMISVILLELRGAKVLLTSFLVSAAVLPLIDGLITVSKANTNQNLLALPYIDKSYRLSSLLPPSPFNISFFIAMTLCIIIWYYMTFTCSGKKISIWGKAPLFAQYAGYSSFANTALSLSISGAMHALTGFFAVTGTYFTCHKGFYTSMGWNALSASLIVSSNSLALIPVSLVLSWLYTSATRVGLTQGFNFDISGIVQGVVLFTIAIPFSIDKIKQNKTLRSRK